MTIVLSNFLERGRFDNDRRTRYGHCFEFSEHFGRTIDSLKGIDIAISRSRYK